MHTSPPAPASADFPFPPIENSRRTQIAGTTPTYAKADAILDRPVPPMGGDRLDFGAGRGIGAALLGYDTLEPYPQDGFAPDYRTADEVPAASYDAVVCLNVLNVLPPEEREAAVRSIVRALRPGGAAVIMTRGRDVLVVTGGTPGPEAMSRVIGSGPSAWYQKGFRPRELLEYVEAIAGATHHVEPLDLGPAAVLLRCRFREGEAPLRRRPASPKG